jgi:hypothetical protein
MSYGFVQDVPADEPTYRKIRSLLPAEAPKGMVAHLVIEREGGLRYFDVWETEADWVRFRDEHVEPAVEQVLASLGLPHDHSMVTSEEVTVVDAWLGDPLR